MTYQYDPRMEEEERKKRALRNKIAQSQVQQMPLQQAQQSPTQAVGGGGSDIKSMLLKQALGSAFGPVGALFGDLFNEGGKVPMQGYNNGGQPKQKRSIWDYFWGSRSGKEGSFRDQTGWNMGGPISANPHGYNEGGSTQATPLKKVMDEDKIEMAREAFERGEARKDAKAAADEKRAQETHQQAMQMKKAAATTNKAPLAKK